jgi:hypothetical protein
MSNSFSVDDISPKCEIKKIEKNAILKVFIRQKQG